MVLGYVWVLCFFNLCCGSCGFWPVYRFFGNHLPCRNYVKVGENLTFLFPFPPDDGFSIAWNLNVILSAAPPAIWGDPGEWTKENGIVSFTYPLWLLVSPLLVRSGQALHFCREEQGSQMNMAVTSITAKNRGRFVGLLSTSTLILDCEQLFVVLFVFENFSFRYFGAHIDGCLSVGKPSFLDKR